MRREPERDVSLILSEVEVIRDALKSAGELALARRFQAIIRDMKSTRAPPGSVECPHCHWGFAPSVIDAHVREKHS